MAVSRTPPAAKSADRSLRSLVLLQSNASTSRALNLISIWKRHAESEGYRKNPFFMSPMLNRSIIVKHRLRANERDDMPNGMSTGTKIILPIDPTDLRLGARSFIIGQRGYENIFEEISTGSAGDRRDASLLELLDELPSLDPFLTRERLKKHGFNPDRCYFDLSDSDSNRMFSFARQELTPLIGVSFGDVDARLSEKTSLLAQKIMANAGDAELEPLRQGLGMSMSDFEEGVFCWKGFIYYKWALTDLLPKVAPVLKEIGKVKPAGPTNLENRAYIEATRERLCQSINQSFDVVRQTLRIYEDAYGDLTRHGLPLTFRKFLLRAPQMFHELGERLGAVQHIVSFWRYRFPEDQPHKVNADELVELLGDFEASIALEGFDNTARW